MNGTNKKDNTENPHTIKTLNNAVSESDLHSGEEFFNLIDIPKHIHTTDSNYILSIYLTIPWKIRYRRYILNSIDYNTKCIYVIILFSMKWNIQYIFYNLLPNVRLLL